MSERGYYNTASLDHVVHWYETTYEIDSATLLELHRAGERLPGLSDGDRHIWLSYYREAQEHRDPGFAERVTHVLAGV